MKKIVLLRIVAVLLMTSLVPPLLAEVGTITYNASYNSSDMILGTDTLGGVTYTTVTYGDLTNGGQPGAPSLPIDYLRFSVPANATNFTVTAVKFNNMLRTINYLVYPCQPPRLMSDTSAWVITPPDNNIYNSGSFYPSASGCAWVADEGFLAGENHIVTVAVMPISFSRQMTGMMSRQLSLAKTITLTLSYELSDSLAMYPIVRNDTSLRNEGYRLAQSMVVNPEGVTGNAPLIPFPIDSINFNPRGGDGLNGLGDVIPGHPVDTLPYDTLPFNQIMTYPYLIVTTPALKNSVRRIAALKEMKGYNVKVVTMDEVLNSPFSGDGDAIKQLDGTYQVVDSSATGKLRQYLKYCYGNLGTEYVLLVGTDVPYRIHNGNPTDLYYSDLSAKWEKNDTTVDKYPELYVGRILAKSSEQIENYTDKLFRYELNPGHGDYGYLRRIFYSEAVDFEFNDEWNHVNSSYIKTFPYTTRILERVNTFFPTGSDIINALNQTKYGYISILNHGCPSGFITYGRRSFYEKDSIRIIPYYYMWSVDSVHIVYNDKVYDDDPSTGNGINNLTNKWYPSICYSAGCEPMPYDTVYGYTIETNFGESFTTGKDYGGPAFLGNTRDGRFGPKSTELEKLFADQISEGQYKVGAAEAISRCSYKKDSYIPLIHNLLGDPEFEIWTDLPHQFSGIGISRSNNSVTVSGIDADSVTVVYRSHNGLHQKMAINKLEDITFSHDVSPNGVVMLYKHNYIPYISPMVLQNVSLNKSHYAIASDVTAGHSVDSILTEGDVTVKNGIDYEIEASGTVTLEDGFKVEKGATFAVYPSCF